MDDLNPYDPSHDYMPTRKVFRNGVYHSIVHNALSHLTDVDDMINAVRKIENFVFEAQA